MPTFNSKNTQIHYRVDGNPVNPALLLSNSLGTDLTMWDNQVNALYDDFYIIRYDTRGHGLSGRKFESFGFDELGLDVLRLIQHLDLSSVNFCGISMGGLVGQWLAINAPDRLTKLVLANTASKIGTTEAWHNRANSVLASGIDPVADTAASRWFSDHFVATHPVDVARLISMLRQTSPRVYADCCMCLGDADFSDGIKTISSPTLVIAGAFDPVTTVVNAEFLTKAIPDSNMVTLNASHLSNVEASDEFNTILKSFL
jgi:3-oxoadipate enol-lactonase